MSFFGSWLESSPEKGFTIRWGRDFKLIVKRSRTHEGLVLYGLEVPNKKQKLIVPRELMDRFRYALTRLRSEGLSPDFDQTIHAKDQDVYRLRRAVGEADNLLIQDLSPRVAPTAAYLTLPLGALDSLLSLLYSPEFGHTSELFERIVRYHQLFHFSFMDGSESITSQLILRRDLLCQIDDYVPSVRTQQTLVQGETSSEEGGGRARETPGSSSREGGTPARFKPKLGERDRETSYDLDYATLFQASYRLPIERAPKASDDQSKKGAREHTHAFPLSISAKELKELKQIPLRCELDRDEWQTLRENFLQDRSAEIYLGFEILDAVYKSEGRLKTFRFPLYFTRVKIEESARVLHITPESPADIYLNHLALATLIESLAQDSKQLSDPLEPFFADLLNQKIDINGRLHEFTLHRQLPLSELVFEKMRIMLLGLPGEHGKGGLLGHLQVAGIACDPDRVILYKAAVKASPVARALEVDMARIHQVSLQQVRRFQQSLLGRFLVPELSHPSPIARFCTRPLCPGALPKSTRKLLDTLNQHDLVVLEGPPGTGKTFTIRNLLIHCVNTGQRLLIVSDQVAAIEALKEKMEEYLLGQDTPNASSRSLLQLWRQAVKLLDLAPDNQTGLARWIAQLTQALHLEQSPEPGLEREHTEIVACLEQIDRELLSLREELQIQLDQNHMDPERRWVASKTRHPTTQQDIDDFLSFLRFAGAGNYEKQVMPAVDQKNREIIRTFIYDRDQLREEPWAYGYADFSLEAVPGRGNREPFVDLIPLVKRLRSEKPRTDLHFHQLLADQAKSRMTRCLISLWESQFAQAQHSQVQRRWRRWRALWRHPLLNAWDELLGLMERQRDLIAFLDKSEDGDAIRRQLQGIHDAFDPQSKGYPSLAFEAALFSLIERNQDQRSAQRLLLRIQELQSERDALIKDLFLSQLQKIVHRGHVTDADHPTSHRTNISNILDLMQQTSSLEHGTGVNLLRELQNHLLSCFPIWITRKQTVSFLFPTQEQIFDLVIIDEAGQCRVDDAIPLLFRAKKLLVVGDEKQTVLDKNSVVDDFLFKAFGLDDHLHQTQSRGMKGGGSHIFGLVKSIRQAEVMLDEHFRCPPDIIAFSNRYVYDSHLKIMQWRHRHMSPSVIVDYSEKHASSNKKASSGKFKDIETELIDRYLEWVAAMIKKLEKEFGRPIQVESEVALCYFLLKNESYIKEKKTEFLQKLKRGSDVLDGAGAALQGKERNFIFYLWDINKGNLRAFRQGDDPNKRKGELNVLMSRPKLRAYHYLHPEFENLKHESASITEYLWKTYQSQGIRKAHVPRLPRLRQPPADFRPWQRASGELIRHILQHMLTAPQLERWHTCIDTAEMGVVVGDPRYRIDLVILAEERGGRSLALVDLAAFEREHARAEEVIDYFFQLQRARPSLEPLFLYLHELADERSDSYQLLLRSLERFGPPSSRTQETTRQSE